MTLRSITWKRTYKLNVLTMPHHSTILCGRHVSNAYGVYIYILFLWPVKKDQTISFDNDLSNVFALNLCPRIAITTKYIYSKGYLRPRLSLDKNIFIVFFLQKNDWSIHDFTIRDHSDVFCNNIPDMRIQLCVGMSYYMVSRGIDCWIERMRSAGYSQTMPKIRISLTDSRTSEFGKTN